MSSVSSFLILVYSFITDTQVATDLFAFVVLQPECICVFQAGEFRAEAFQRFQHGVQRSSICLSSIFLQAHNSLLKYSCTPGRCSGTFLDKLHLFAILIIVCHYRETFGEAIGDG